MCHTKKCEATFDLGIRRYGIVGGQDVEQRHHADGRSANTTNGKTVNENSVLPYVARCFVQDQESMPTDLTFSSADVTTVTASSHLIFLSS